MARHNIEYFGDNGLDYGKGTIGKTEHAEGGTVTRTSYSETCQVPHGAQDRGFSGILGGRGVNCLHDHTLLHRGLRSGRQNGYKGVIVPYGARFGRYSDNHDVYGRG